MQKLILKLALASLIAAWASAGLTADTELGSLSLEQPWTTATPPSAPTAIAYLIIRNTGSGPDRLVAVTSPAAKQIQISEMTMTKNVMAMRQLTDGLPIQGGATVTMGPDGYHLMLVGLAGPLTQGAAIPLTLQFEKAGTITVSFPVQPIGARGPDNGHVH